MTNNANEMRVTKNMQTQERSKRNLAPLFVILGALCWGTYGSFVTKISAWGLGQNALVSIRFLFTALPMFLFLLCKDPGKLKIPKKDMPLFLANGIVSIVFFTSCYTAAIRYTKIATAAALLYTAPAIVLILSAILFKEKLTGKKIICVLFSVLGCALCSGLAGGADLTRKGLLLGLGAGLGYALYSIFSRYIQMRGYTTYTNILYTFGIATIVYIVMACVDGSAQNSIQHPEAIALAALCGLVTGCAAYILYTEGLSKMAPPTASVLATIEPVTAAILGVVLFGQTLSIMEIMGIVLVVGSVIAMNVGHRS